jgi:acetylxylan esterase
MTRNSTLGALWVGALGVLAVPAAQAASLQQVQVSSWTGGTSFPSDISMSIYVPDKVATNPPILTLVHYCGGTASAVFGQASGGGIVKAADQYGFIMVVPSSGRCWDVVSSMTRTRDGGGDSHAIKQMVKYAITKYQANADRVYSTGDSSGGMMTQLLLALYPDIFKAGASMAGMPAGCGTTTSSPGGYDGACAGGTVTHTPQEWGDIVRKMNPGYTGHRARVQLFHGTADEPSTGSGYISFKNQAEAVKEWSNVLGLSTTPTSTETGLTLGTHQATRDKWLNSCGYLVLDAFTSIGGDHGPSDALFLSQYVIPFLGLDKTGPVDPEIAACSGDAGAGGTGGANGTGGSTGVGGTGGARDGGQGGSADAGRGGAGGGGGETATGGSVGSGGRTGTGGSGGSGGAQATGGSPGTGGSGGVQATGGSGGAVGSGGAAGSGGSSANGGSSGKGSGGTSSQGGSGGNAGSSGSSGCGCVLGGATSKQTPYLVMAALGLAWALVRRRRT